MTSRHTLEQVYFENLHATRGMDPEVAADLGYTVTPEAFAAAVDGAHRVAEAGLPKVIDDPELNAAWHAEQAEKERLPGVARPAGRLTIASMNASEARAIAAHRRRVPKQIQGR